MARLLPEFKPLQLKPDLKNRGVAAPLQFAAQKQGQLHISGYRVNPSGAALNVLQFGFPDLRHGWTMLFELGQPRQLGHCGCHCL